MLAWIDCETTGLDPERDALLEVALVVTDNALNEIGFTSVILPYDYDHGRLEIDPKVRDMHSANGLWGDCDQMRRLGADAAESESVLIRVMRQYLEPGTTPMCGSTIGFDRVFLRRHMPRFERLFHYRNVDVSAIGELAARWAPEMWNNRPRGSSAHRALPDVRHSIELLNYWRDHFLLGGIG